MSAEEVVRFAPPRPADPIAFAPPVTEPPLPFVPDLPDRYLTEEHLQLGVEHAVDPAVLHRHAYTDAFNGRLTFVWDDGTRQVPQQRLSESERQPDGPKYLFPNGSGKVVNRLRPAGPGQPTLVVEGTFQQLAALSWAPEGYGITGIAGCANWDLPSLLWAEHCDVVVFLDADATTNLNVWNQARQMGNTLTAAGATSVRFAQPMGRDRQGLDDVLAEVPDAKRGGIIGRAVDNAVAKLPKPTAKTEAKVVDINTPLDQRAEATAGFFSDLKLAELLARDVLAGRFCYTGGAGWLKYDGRIWKRCTAEDVRIVLHDWCRNKFADAVLRNAERDLLAEWHKTLGVTKQKALVDALRSELLADYADFDADPDVLNTPAGLLDLRTLTVVPHSPQHLVTRVTSGSYVPGAEMHPDWQQALTAITPGAVHYLQVRFGQGATGHRTPDGKNLLLQGGGENGKSVLTTDGVKVALGEYAGMASPKLLYGNAGDHSTEIADLKGQRFLIAEEGAEDATLNVTVIKRISDLEFTKARFIRQDNIEIQLSHSLFLTSNPRPSVKETDHGTWRRLELVPFPYKFVKHPAGANERLGDPTLKLRIKQNLGGQHDAIVTWLALGAHAWYQAGQVMPETPEVIVAATNAWRAENDAVQHFWSDAIEPAPGHCVLSLELLEAFNEMRDSLNQGRMSMKGLAMRFDDHDATKQNLASPVKRRVRTAQLEGQNWILSRKATRWGTAPPNDPPDMTTVYFGLRFRKGVEAGS